MADLNKDYIIYNLEEAKVERQQAGETADLLAELRSARQTIDRVEKALSRKEG